MAHILIAEGQPELSELACRTLTLVGHECRCADSGAEAQRTLKEGNVDLALLDVRLDGLALLSARPDGSVPVLLTAARSNLADRARGLALGAEAYVVKPFDTFELVTLVTAALRRAGRAETGFCIDGLSVDFTARRASLDGAPVPLSPQEYGVLEALIVNRNIALSRERLLSLASGDGRAAGKRAADGCVQRLRKLLRLENRIRTVYKLGYRFET